MADSNAASEGAPGESFDVFVKVNGDSLHVVLTEAEWNIMRDLLKEAQVAPAKSKPGDTMPDGTIYAGISPNTHEPMYTTPADAPLTYSFDEAGKYAAKLDAHGHKDWRVPTKAELNVMFNNRAAIGGFDESGSYPRGWYWSVSEDGGAGARGQCFSDGQQDAYYKGDVGDSSLRCVR